MTDLEVLEALGHELRRRGRDWQAKLPPLRVLYRHVREGTQPTHDEWSLKHALDLAGLLGLGANPFPIRPWNSKCPTCPPEARGPRHMGGMRTFSCGSLPDRAGEYCLLCGFRWVVARENFVFSKGDTRSLMVDATDSSTHCYNATA